MLLPNVAVTGIVSKMSVGTPTGLSTREQRIINEFTLEPIGIVVFKIE